MKYTIVAGKKKQKAINEALSGLEVTIKWNQETKVFDAEFDDSIITPVSVNRALLQLNLVLKQEVPYPRVYDPYCQS